MIKLTEIVKTPEYYDQDTKNVVSSFNLRSLYVNPSHVVSMTMNDGYNASHERKPLIEELTPHAKFTTLTLFSGANHHSYHNILGSPGAIASLLRDPPEAK